MTLITFILHVAAMLLASLTLAHYLGKAGTERRPLFPFRPFNCRPCLTFWLAVLLWAWPAYLRGARLCRFRRGDVPHCALGAGGSRRRRLAGAVLLRKIKIPHP